MLTADALLRDLNDVGDLCTTAGDSLRVMLARAGLPYKKKPRPIAYPDDDEDEEDEEAGDQDADDGDSDGSIVDDSGFSDRVAWHVDELREWAAAGGLAKKRKFERRKKRRQDKLDQKEVGQLCLSDPMVKLILALCRWTR